MSYKSSVPRFDVTHTDLAFYASEASIDLSNIVHDRRQDDESIKYLSRIFDEGLKGEEPRVMFPFNKHVLAYAIPGREKFAEYWKGKDDSDILSEITHIAEDLRNFRSLDKKKQEFLEDFCRRLSTEVLRHQQECHSDMHRLAA